MVAAHLMASFQQNLDMRVFLDGFELNPRQECATTDIFRLLETNSFDHGAFGAAAGFHGALGPLPPSECTLRTVARNEGINFASDPKHCTLEDGAINTRESGNVFWLSVSQWQPTQATMLQWHVGVHISQLG